MTQLSLRCIRAAFIFMACGIGLGASFALDRTLGAQLRPLHAEFNLWGWLTLLIYGFGYHMLPRFNGRPLRSQRLADAQSWLAIGGVTLTTVGWISLVAKLPLARALMVVGGAGQFAAVLIFVWLIGSLLLPARERGR